ncbi:MAG: MBL fold metallo-hydrolase [Propionivibrio sp.]
MSIPYTLHHHGAVDGVTGPCHQLLLGDGRFILVGCGLSQGVETSADGGAAGQLEIGFPVADILVLVLTHVHIDHVGRIPHLLAAGFRGPIICSEASVALLPLVLEDALKVGFTRDESLIRRFLGEIREQLVPLPYQTRHTVIDGPTRLRVEIAPAGHLLGSTYVQVALENGNAKERVVFSGDLGAPYTPLLPAPRAPYGADTLVLESTYGDRRHPNRKDRRQRLQAMVERALANKGSLLIPAFSIGRTQELLYEQEEIVRRQRSRHVAAGLSWEDLDIVVGFPLAAEFTSGYLGLIHEHDS